MYVFIICTFSLLSSGEFLSFTSCSRRAVWKLFAWLTHCNGNFSPEGRPCCLLATGSPQRQLSVFLLWTFYMYLLNDDVCFCVCFFVNAGRLSRARESIRGRRGVYAPGLKWSPVPSAFVETAGGDSCRVGLAKCGTKLKWCRWVWRFIYFLL